MSKNKDFLDFHKKIIINSFYLTTPVPYFGLFDLAVAEEITKKGKEEIRLIDAEFKKNKDAKNR